MRYGAMVPMTDKLLASFLACATGLVMLLSACQTTPPAHAFFADLDAKRLEVSNSLEALRQQPPRTSPIEEVEVLGIAQEIIWDYVAWLETVEVPADPPALLYLVDKLAENGHQYGIYLHGQKIATATANESALRSLKGALVIAEAANVNLTWYELKLRRELGVPIPKPGG